MILQNNQFSFYKAKMKHADLTHITLSWLKKVQKRENPYVPKLPIWGIKGFMGLENDPSPFMHSPQPYRAMGSY